MIDLALKMLLNDRAKYIMPISGLTFASLLMIEQASIFGMIVLHKGMTPFFMPYYLPIITLAAILFICWLAASLGIRKIRNLEPAVVFRG